MKTNSLYHRVTKNLPNGARIHVEIRLNDECKNGHQDFAITGSLYEKYDRPGNPSMSGCIHEEILKHFPEFRPFVDLHLCDYKGIPMHAGANGYYHLTNGFNNTKPENPKFRAEYCEYYRITPAQFEALKASKNVIQFSLALQNLGILEQWEKEANRAIKLLESLTGNEFLVDSKRTQFVEPTPEQIKEEEEKQKNGYYTPEAEQQRENEKQAAILQKLEAERDKDINKAQTEFEVKKQVLMIGGKKALDNCIFYNHTQQLTFNWRGYDHLSTEAVQHIMDHIQLPEGVTVKNANK